MVERSSRKMGKLRQVQTTVAVSFGPLVTGLLYVWPSYTAQLYTDPKTDLLSAPMSDVEVSLIGSLPSLGAMLGTAVTGVVLSVFGRHKGGLIVALPYLLSWVIISLTTSSIVIMAARFIGGISAGAFLVYGPIFISEVADESIRGLLATGPVAFYCFGVLLSYVFGWFLTYRYVVWGNIVFSVTLIALIMSVTESPIWLMRQKREEDARLAIAHYRGASPASKMVLEEVSRLKALVNPAVELVAIIDDKTKAEEAEKEKLNAEEHVPEEQENVSTFKLLFLSPSSRRALIVTGLTLSIQVMMGMIVIQVYAKNIFEHAAPSLSSDFCSVMFAFILLAGSLLSAVFSDKFGRRILLVSSSIVVCLCLIGMGILINSTILPAWVTAILILIYCFAFMFGAGSVPYVLLAETFKPEVQSLASMLLMEWVWLLNFFLIAIYPFIVKYFGVPGAFYLFAGFAVADTLVGIFLLPETKGLTTEQIQEAFLGRRK